MLLLCASAAFGANAPGTSSGASQAANSDVASNGVSGPGEQTSYQDRLIDGGNLSPDVSEDLYGGHDPNGWPRAFRIQATTSRLTRNDRRADESGVRMGGMLETPDYGALTLDASLRASSDFTFGSGGLFTLWQLGLPMNGGWFGNNALGVFNTPSTDLARQQFRFFIPSIATAGAATEWRQAGNLQLHAAIGQPGVFTGLYVPGFERLGGRVASGGLQWNISREWAAGVQMANVDAVRFGPGPLAGLGTFSAQSWYAGTAWGTPTARAQLNVIDSTAQGGPHRTGVWLDAGVRDNRVWHTFGAFHLAPNLVWGNQPLTNNLQGGYYRAAFQSRQWILDGGVDYVTPVSGAGTSQLYAIGNARYQYRTGLGFGGGANVRSGTSDAWSVFGFVDQLNPLGVGRAQANFASDGRVSNAQLTLDQSWNNISSVRLSTALLLGRENLASYDTNSVGAAVYGGGQLRSNLTLDVNARYTKAFGEAAADTALANVALNWAFAAGWTASANYYESRNAARLPLTVTSPIPGPVPVQLQRLDDRGVFFSLRYEWQAGTRSAALGGYPGSGSGSVAGVLYLDANDSGRFEAGESGAGNVVILLDGRFAARTDAEGRFEFPSVAPGDHVLSVVPDNLPLPWVVSSEGRIDVKVRVRDRTRVEIQARRLR